MVKWYCASALCFNNFKSKDSNGLFIKHYRLPRSESVQKIYMRLFKTSGMNWEKGHMWSSLEQERERKS